jgi:hypothetical protein
MKCGIYPFCQPNPSTVRTALISHIQEKEQRMLRNTRFTKLGILQNVPRAFYRSAYQQRDRQPQHSESLKKARANPKPSQKFLADFQPWINSVMPDVEQALSRVARNGLLKHKDVLSKSQIELVHDLMNDPEVKVTTADKNLGIVLVDTSWYEGEMSRQLNDLDTYQVFCDTATEAGKQTLMQRMITIHKEVNLFINNHHIDGNISNLLTMVTPQMATVPKLRLHPKIHKRGRLKGRAIAGAFNWLTTVAAKLLHYLLQPYLEKLAPTCVSSSAAVIQKIERLQLDKNKKYKIICADVEALYPSLPIRCSTLRKLLANFLNLIEPIIDGNLRMLIMDLARLALSHALVQYNSIVYEQVDGGSMGNPAMPVLANICLFMLERQHLFSNEIYQFVPSYSRFLDDLCIVTEEQAVDQVVQIMSNMHRKIRFTFSISADGGVFLDLNLSFGNRYKASGILDIECYQKPDNIYSYVPWISMHPKTTKLGVIKGEMVRYIRNSSDEQQYVQRVLRFAERIHARGFPRRVVISTILRGPKYHQRESFIERAASSSRRLLDERSANKSAKKPFVLLPFHPAFESARISQILRSNPNYPVHVRVYNFSRPELFLADKSVQAGGIIPQSITPRLVFSRSKTMSDMMKGNNKQQQR